MTTPIRPQFTPHCSFTGCKKRAGNGHFCGLAHATQYAEDSLKGTKWCFMCKGYKVTDTDACPDCKASPLQGTTFTPPNLSQRGRKAKDKKAPKKPAKKPAAKGKDKK